MKIIIPAHVYAAALAFAATKDIRYYLNGVFVTKADNGQPGCYVVSTDGHALLCQHVPDMDAPEADTILPRLKLAAKDLKPGAMLEFDGQRVTCASGASLPATYIDGRFPDWRMVTATARVQPLSATPVSFNPELVGRCNAVTEAYGRKPSGSGVTLANYGPENAMLATFDTVDAFAIIMPLRGVKGGGSLPAWLPSCLPTPVPQAVAA